jgi:sugar lactone lactonase YvrE
MVRYSKRLYVTPLESHWYGTQKTQKEVKMKGRCLLSLSVAVILVFGWSSAWAQFPNNPSFTTFFTSAAGIEGLTGHNNGNFYVADRTAGVCNVWKINTNIPAPNSVDVGKINVAGCAPAGLTFDRNGNLYITNGSTIYKLTPDEISKPQAMLVAQNVPGANGVAFDKQGNLLVSDGTQNQGRVWKIVPAGGVANCAENDNCEEFFRVPPRRNGENLGGNVDPADQPDGVGSVRYTVPRHNTTAASATDKQDIVANGIALSADGRFIFVADTARGAIWRVELRQNGMLQSRTGCDPTLTKNTICMDSLYVAHPLLEGVDGIILLIDGTILASVNERNAIVAIAPDKKVSDAFQNAADRDTLLRNGRTDDRFAPLEFPTSPFASGTKFCTTNADTGRRDNNPSTTGEGPKVNCLDQNLMSSGLPLPVQ